LHIKDIWGWIKDIIKEKKYKKKPDEYLTDYKLYEYKEFCEGLIRDHNLKDLNHLKFYIKDALDKKKAKKNYIGKNKF